MITMTEFAKKHGVTRSWIHNLLLQRRIPGAKLKRFPGGHPKGVWLIPEDAEIKALDSRKR